MILPDVLGNGLKVVFCGTAVGNRSAKRRCYYSGPGNRFWPMLKKLDLVPDAFRPEVFRSLPKHGIGLTDLVKTRHANDKGLRAADFNAADLRAKILRFSPRVLAFNGKKAAQIFLGRAVSYGLQEERIGRTMLLVLPSTSGAANGFWNEEPWTELVRLLNKAAR